MSITLQDLVEVVTQPEYSKSKLLALQEKYNLDTIQAIRLYREGIPLPISSKDMENWLFQFDMFVATDGNIFDLIDAHTFDTSDTPLAA